MTIGYAIRSSFLWFQVSGVRCQVSVKNQSPGPDRTIHESGK
ncbi:hypothetical protein D1AOALGA4SA_8083 [Olavius algarvensis Delta 1 endosymbiont]|nr:hypothetical protein D1AOALGA4SA_8083 [Olavius algarvensis Delta 1 endosymbiont]